MNQYRKMEIYKSKAIHLIEQMRIFTFDKHNKSKK